MHWSVLTLACVLLLGCAAPPRAPVALPGNGLSPVEIRLIPERERQTIRGFGASDAWSIQFVGQNWPVEKRERIADLLFSQELKPDGSPAGIGLSAWRFNIGAGSAAQGDDSGIKDEWRRAESFLRPDGSYDWSRQAGQRWFLRAARERGVERFTAFSNSPPVVLTRNGKAFSSGGDLGNLAADRYDDFARFLRDVVAQVERREGVRLDYLSPVNEPQWDWKGGQEGSPWLNTEIHRLVVALDAALQDAGLSTRIEIPESGKLNYLYEDADRPGRGSQVEAFFLPSSPLYVGALPSVAHKVAAHSYFTTEHPGTLVDVRTRVRDEIREVDPRLEFWMSEYCLLENNDEIKGSGRDLGMEPALYMARVIHADLTVADASSWQWWLAVSPYDYKDGLVYIDRDKHDGRIYESKMLWALGHFSRFVRPGMKRIEVARSDGPGLRETETGLLASAYSDPSSGRLVAVLVNQAHADAPVRLVAPRGRSGRYYVTTAQPGEDLALRGAVPASGALDVPARSLVTVVWE